MEKAAEKVGVDINRMPHDFWAKGERVLATAEGPKMVESAWEACLSERPDKARFFFDDDGKDFSKWARAVNSRIIAFMKAEHYDEPYHGSVLEIMEKAVQRRLLAEPTKQDHIGVPRTSTEKPPGVFERDNRAIHSNLTSRCVFQQGTNFAGVKKAMEP